MNIIDYGRIGAAIRYYSDLGYKYVEVPWAVPGWAINVTAPACSKPMLAPGSVLIGSAEQAFIYLEESGQLEKGKFVACSPCFRRGDDRSEFHQQTFMKVELYANDRTDIIAVQKMIEDARNFAQDQAADTDYRINVVATNDFTSIFSYDINLNDIEIGSYGSREHGALQWVYGTGVAEPRFSMAKSRIIA